MEYRHPQFVYRQDHLESMLYHQHTDPQLTHMHPYAHLDYSDFPSHGSLQEEFEENQEILSRPRLTKDQVEILESQFQAHPKPNSNVKRQLAIQTKLTLPRVANWFQNRRAKAKQQKKQEEFEISQSRGTGEAWSGDATQPPHPYPACATEQTSEPTKAQTQAQAPKSEETHTDAQTIAAVPISRSTSAQEASWASLQRALALAKAARATQIPSDDSFINRTTLESPPNVSDMTSSNDGSQFPSSTFSDWTNPSSVDWMSSSHLSTQSDQQLDFQGLNIHQLSVEQLSRHDAQLMFQSSPEAVSAASGVSENPSEDWSQNLHTPTLTTPRGKNNVDNAHVSQSMPLSLYPQERRRSSQEDLSISMGNVGITQLTPTPPAVPNPPSDMFARRDSSVDIAARRKKPRPAMLGSAALRSRSYGAPPSHSPTIRYGPSPIHPLRHVKSTGNNLNVHYSGIRKANSAQRSPLNFSTFAEAEAFNAMMASAPSLECRTSSAPPPNASLSPEEHSGLTLPATATRVADLPTGPAFGPYTHLDTTSPPATPFKGDTFSQYISMAPPISARPQYAVFPDYTPPYSAGPLTAGSWSDAPLTSPDHLSFAQGMSQAPSYISPMIHDTGSSTHFPSAYSPSEMRAGSDPHKPTEFFIQEFPQQKEAHAHAAQQLSQQKPKNYVFANATATDFNSHDFSE